MLSEAQKLNLQAAFEAARECERETGCPAALSIAQWALESGWGVKCPGNNCFGIKAYDGAFGVQMLPTWEVENGHRVEKRLPFATFPTLTACFVKHAQLITGAQPYHAAWVDYNATGSLDSLIRGIAPVYATDPDYAGKLLSIIRMQDVQNALNITQA